MFGMKLALTLTLLGAAIAAAMVALNSGIHNEARNKGF